MTVLVNTIESFERSLLTLRQSPQWAVDIETYVLPEYRGKATALDVHRSNISICSVQGFDPPTEVYVLDFIALENEIDNFKEIFFEVMSSREHIVAHNLSFELMFFKKYFGKYPTNGWCTRIGSQLIANATGNRYYRSASGFSLKDVCRDFLLVHLEGKGAVQISDWSVRPLTTEMIEYAANDVYYLPELKKMFLDILEPALPKIEGYTPGEPFGLGMGNIVDLEMQFCKVEAECQYNGFPINRELTYKFEEALLNATNNSGETMRIAGELCKEFNLSTQYPNDFESDYQVPTQESLKTLNNPKKVTQLINDFIAPTDTSEGAVLRRIVDLLDSVVKSNTNDLFYSEEEEKKFEQFLELEEVEAVDKHKAAQLLVKYKQLAKQSSMRLSKYIHPTTGRIHYSLNSLGAATGRCS